MKNRNNLPKPTKDGVITHSERHDIREKDFKALKKAKQLSKKRLKLLTPICNTWISGGTSQSRERIRANIERCI